MASVTVYTAERMQEIEDNAVIDGSVNGSGHLILEKHNGTTIDAGSVIGPTGSPGVSEATFVDHFPIGSILDYIGTSNPSSKWIKCEGQTVVNAQTLYPTLWALLPASMKSGSSMIMPDARGKVSVGYQSGDADFNAINKTGGTKTHTLSVSEMPIHTHVQDAHDHAQDPHTHVQNPHTHIQDPHLHAPGTLATLPPTNDTHSHTAPSGIPGSFVFSDGSGGPSGGIGNAGSGFTLSTSTHTSEPTDTLSRPFHTHVINGATQNTTATNQNMTAVNQNATANNQPTTAVNQNAGGGAAHNNLQPYIVFMKILKVL